MKEAVLKDEGNGMSEKVEKSSAYVWFDAEFTSLELESARLLQIAIMVTDAELKRMAPPEDDLNLFIRIEANEPVSDWVQEHLPELVKRCRSDEAISMAEADGVVGAYLDRLLGAPSASMGGRPLLAGNSVHNDWFLARRFLPSLVSRLHYRLLDVSTLKVQWQDWAGLPPFDKENVELLNACLPDGGLRTANAHDALFDIQASVAELAYYRKHLAVASVSAD